MSGRHVEDTLPRRVGAFQGENHLAAMHETGVTLGCNPGCDHGGNGRRVAEAIRWAIRREDQLHAWVAISAGLSPDELSQRLTGKVPLEPEDLDGIARALCTTPPALLRVADALEAGEDPGRAYRADVATVL